MEFNFTVRGDRITADKEYAFVEGNKGYYEAVFDFGEDEVWLSGAKICIVENKDKVFEIPVIGNRCILPEMLRGSSKIGVFCVVAENEESERASTNMIAVGVQDGASGAQVNAEMSTAAEVWEKYLSDMEQNRAAAEEARSKAEGAAIDASGFADTAIESAESIRNMEVSAQALPPGSAPRVIKSINPDGSTNLHYLIPAGEKGETGPQGARGEKGDSLNYDEMTENQKEDLADRVAEKIDISEVENEAINNLKYYGDVNISPSDESLFSFTPDDETMTVSVKGRAGNIVFGDVVVPYKYTSNGKTYMVTTISYNAFNNKDSITSVVISNSVKTIEPNAFIYCDSITSVAIPKSVTSIGVYAFLQCSALTDIYYKGSKEDWSKITLGSQAIPSHAKIHYNWIGATQGYVDDKIGDIDAALDEIIAIQEELMTSDGDEVEY